MVAHDLAIVETVYNVRVREIPPELRALRNWTAWYWAPQRPDDEDRGESEEWNQQAPRHEEIKWAKIPLRVAGEHAGKPGSHSDPASWGTLQQAVRYLVDHRRDVRRRPRGLQFHRPPDRSIVAIDLDDAVDDAGRLKPWAQALVDTLPRDAWLEFSYSGKGLHVFVWGEKPGTRCKLAAPDGIGCVEIYDNRKAIAITGERPAADTDPPRLVHAELTELWRVAGFAALPDLRPIDPAAVPATWADAVAPESIDPERIARMLPAGEARDLWAGRWTSHFSDRSRADFWLAIYLRDHISRSPRLIYQLMRASGMYRKKWDSGRNGMTHLQATILRVCGSR